MKSTPMRREFSFNGLKLPDPNPQMSVEDVRGVLSMQYPEIATAAISGPEPVGEHDEVHLRARDRFKGVGSREVVGTDAATPSGV
jgi:PRTRC genetic system protein C